MSTQPFVFGSVGFPGVWASWRHLSSAARYLAMQPVLPARHLACWADVGAAGTSSSTVTSTVPIERLVMFPLRRAAIKEMEAGQAECFKRRTTKDTTGWLCQRISLTFALRRAARREGTYVVVGGT